ncbi:MAG: hypothetical protein ABJD07_02075 [Gemmatimonadaceae bacterium]
MGSRVNIRSLTSHEDCDACVALQREVWGFGQDDIVPSSVLHIVQYVGGIAVGAFDDEGLLLGFVFGVSGVRDGVLSHWSHMLGVRESARNLGLGRMLKEHQRRALADIAVKRIYWTFDPLMAKNAHFNFNRLCARVVEYVPDMYGASSSPIHLGLATDRLVVFTPTTPPLSEPDPAWTAAVDTLPVLTPFPAAGDAVLARGAERPPAVLLEMPADILADAARDASAARTWREAVRANFLWAIGNGYIVAGVRPSSDGSRYYYVLAPDKASPRPDGS